LTPRAFRLQIAKTIIDPQDMFTVESGLIDLAQKAGSFMVILVEQGSINKFSDSDSMKSAIDGLTK
jgi:hypothetical protein